MPPIPPRLLHVDETTRNEHYRLAASDLCYYLWEYTAGRRYDFSPTNQLIANLKIKPSQLRSCRHRGEHKQRAIEHSAMALRALIPQSWVEECGTLVPMPASKAQDHADYDDRIGRLLELAFTGFAADIRPVLRLSGSAAADHESSARISFAALRRITCIDNARVAEPPRRTIAIVDDVLNSGKHFKVAQELLKKCFPGVPIVGIFIARCVHGRRQRTVR